MSDWKLVPVELTDEMERVAWNAVAQHDQAGGKYQDQAKVIYGAMLAAAPTPPAQARHELDDADNGGLRKAAEKLIRIFDRIKCLESRYGPCPAIEDLRAALEEL